MNRKNIYEQLKIDEGVKFEVYLDSESLPTVGVGHLILEEDYEYEQSVGTPITEERAFTLFENDLDIAINECEKLYNYDMFEAFPDEVQEILVNMMFNLGRPRLGKFHHMNDALANLDWSVAADEMVDSKWWRNLHGWGSQRAHRLVARMRNV